MAYRVAPRVSPDPIPKVKPRKSSNYLAFIRRLPCCVTGFSNPDAAHLSYAAPQYGHYGRGKGTKAPDRWVLPLYSTEHAAQHSGNEREYWASVGINPHVLALTLWGLWSDLGDDAHEFAVAVINAGLARRGLLRERELS